MDFDDDIPPALMLLAYFKHMTDSVLADTAQANEMTTINQIKLIVFLGSHRAMKEVSDVLLMHPSNVTGLVNVCEEAGWIERIPSQTDKRAKLLALTEAGVAVRQHVIKDLVRQMDIDFGINDEVASKIMSLINLPETTC
ncbi:MarR family winged helix-turn-helix transcriptional regulator [Pacificoceanicola onchidii]|uniref:MarR family winged helix-turn-helix transcriptional regulator n=1 Tax=Pacificoceanicola onchidii TaxID=2562685 RepID=UPI0010A3E445|nr:MarR family transcriptional regulator [Pacificoceanicola onchidii]